jgi:hypothetical protein
MLLILCQHFIFICTVIQLILITADIQLQLIT